MPKRKYSGSSGGSTKRPKTASRAYRSTPRATAGYYRRVGLYNRFRGRRGMVELKFFDTSITPTPVTAVPLNVMDSLNKVSQGNAPTNMIGRKITIKRISAKLNFRLTGSTGNTAAGIIGFASTVIKLMLILDKQANGAIASAADVLTDTDIFSFNSMQNSSRFKIIKNWVVDLNSSMAMITGNFSWGESSKFIEWSKRCNIDIEMKENAGARALSDIRSNNLFLVVVGSDALGTVDGRFRIRFADA